MTYPPELSWQESAVLRRIAFNLNRPMTKTLSTILRTTAEQFSDGEERHRYFGGSFNLEP